jgi:hypothetical protein
MSRRKRVKGRAQERAPAGTEERAGQTGAAGRRASAGQVPKKLFALLIGTAVAVTIAFVSVLVMFSRSGGQSEEPPTAVSSGAPRAAIVDQLTLTQANPAFVQTATDLFEQAGYTVDYYPGEEVTVEFYRKFPVQPYALIIFRVHSALGREDDQPADWVTLFTSDVYHETWYVEEQKTRRLSKVSYYKDGPPYFGIMPDFVKSSMKGDLQGTTVVLMGCDGLATETIAKALVEKGAKAVVSWNGLVSGDHTDAATVQLLRHSVIEGLPLREAVDRTAAEVGPDPTYGSVLRLYPPEGE